ncbi:hypothetical protein G5V57_17150 [Nordella sp. HKS 07]|uniref:hypothetical protein n=1 Tax=Nordella sp. HKS 07 TaxID=2712222 RepID=UPI0013E16965|nr:hypothetical protein [Nordella sp. HKS 07]QIG49295.1 hypothetical protein G5V57_17150 [Nordella sp. HKS 07]
MSKTQTVANFTSCEVSGDGEAIRLSYRDDGGAARDLHLSAEQAGALAMTLPRLLSAALRARSRDPSLRFVFPLAECNLEAAAGSSHRILSLRTSDGFEVCFSLSQEALAEMGELLGLGAEPAGGHGAMH